jgi:hypothetical protein
MLVTKALRPNQRFRLYLCCTNWLKLLVLCGLGARESYRPHNFWPRSIAESSTHCSGNFYPEASGGEWLAGRWQVMAQCTICSHEKARDINRLLLTRGQVKAVALEFGLNRGTVFNHLRKHLPWRSRRHPKPATIAEKLEQLEFELRRLQVLAESGESIGAAIQALNARRAVVELEARLEGRLDATHRKLMMAARPPEGNLEVIFENGKPKTVAKQ